MARDFRKIVAWRRAHALTLDVYRVTSGFPGEERFGLVSQMRRSSASIPMNVAEGCGRESESELRHFIATGSASELEYQLLLAHDLGYLNEEQHTTLSSETVEIRRMLLAYAKTLKPSKRAGINEQ